MSTSQFNRHLTFNHREYSTVRNHKQVLQALQVKSVAAPARMTLLPLLLLGNHILKRAHLP